MTSLVRLDRIFREVKDLAPIDGMELLTPSTVYGVVPQASLESKPQQAFREGYQVAPAQPDDFVISLSSYAHGIEWCGLNGGISPDYTLLRPIVDKQYSRYLKYALKSQYVIGQLGVFKTGVRMGLRLTWSKVRYCTIDLPPLPEAVALATHLDRATARIDALVAKKTRFIELLREKRQALITHAVTKGLDPNVPMKESGVEWLGVTPSSWKPTRLRFVASIRNSNVDKKSYDGQIPVLLCNYTDVYYNERITSADGLMEATASPSEIEKFELRRGDVIITKDSETPDDIGIPALVANDLPGVVCGYHLTQLRAYSDVYPDYLLRVLQATNIRKYLEVETPGVTRYGLDQDTIGSIPISLPPMPVQQKIIDFLDRSTERIDALIGKTKQSIELLREHRTVLITAAVTGKIDFREHAGNAQ